MNEAFQRLLDNVNHPDPETRIAALDAIGQWRAEHDDSELTRRALPRTTAALSDEVRDVRWAAAYALGAMGHVECVPALIGALWRSQGDPGLQLVIVKALGKIDCPDAIPALEALTASCGSRCVRVAATRSLARLNRAAA